MSQVQGTQSLCSSVRAAASSKSAAPGECKNCTGKAGLAVLPISFAPAPSYMKKWLSSNAEAVSELARLEASFKAKDGGATWYYLRTLQTGYLYIYKSDNTWDAYVVGTDGMLNRMAIDSLPETSDEISLSSCCRQGHSNIKPHFITIDSSLETVWIGFSHHKWLPEVIKRYEDDEDGCRTRRMTKLNVQAAASGDVGTGTKVPFGMRVSAESLRGIADFTPKSFQRKFSKFVPRQILELEDRRIALAAEMSLASVNIPSKTGVALVIPDPVGIGGDHNTLRKLAKAHYEDWKGGGPRVDGGGIDGVRAWKRQSATHVAYIEEWVRQREMWEGAQTAQSLKKISHDARDNGNFLITEREFQRRHGQAVNEPLKKGAGLNIYHKARWVPSIDSETARLRMTQSKFSETQDPRDYDPSWRSEALGSVEYSEDYYKALAESKGKRWTDEKLERYRKRLDTAALSQFNLAYAAESEGWEKEVAAIDKDYADYVEGVWPAIICANDFGAGAAPAANAGEFDIRRAVCNAIARLRTVEAFYGGGAESEASFQALNKQFNLDVRDKQNWFAGALLSGFSLLDSAASPGNAGTVYSAIVGGSMLPNSWWQEFRKYQQSAVSSAESLVGGIQQVASENRKRILDAAKGKGVAHVAAALEDVAVKEIVWVRAAALWDFIDTRKEHYSIKVKMSAGAYLDAVASGNAAAAGAFELNERRVGDRTASRRANADSKKLLTNLKKRPEFQGDIIVPLIVEKETLERARGKNGAVRLYNIGQAASVAELPADVVEDLVQSNSIYRQRGWKGFVKAEVGFSIFAIFFSARQLWDAVIKLGSTSGFNFADAAANLTGGIAGTVGGAMEIMAFAYQSSAKEGAQVATSLLAANVERALFLRFLAGASAGIGAVMSGISAAISAQRTSRSGEYEAAHNYRIAATMLLSSGVATVGGSLITWKAALASRVGQQVAMRVLGGVALRTSVGALVGASMTGVGIVLLIIGIAWAIYAASLEHDENERFLDRSFFGKHERTEGRFGGAQVADEDSWVAGGLSEEVLALGALAKGISAVIENWEDNVFSDDVVTAVISVADWDPSRYKAGYVLEGYAAMPDSAGGRLQSGALLASSDRTPLVFSKISEETAGYSAKISVKVPGAHEVVRLIYSLHDLQTDEAIARGEVWEKD
ncbi:T6SS effector BTH_I2691 family protein [Stenotrophomonas sp. ATCM1_4]|uniref:T6SS effector BTH_I2691 family protein n=1 Tax=Stenotrophomonas sp. ATCM1_4 TaxID=2259330 RepID=UPI001047DC33|nr:T6SS effector BTH_I2691 family protein [Stenotrophomonas sp. ATCM1_4]